MAMPRQEERVRDPKKRWYFTKEELANSPSRREHGVESDKELSYRQQAANMIQDMGQKLNVNQLCINTAIVYMHRFYVVHSFRTFHRHLVATASLFLAAKSEEQPRKLQYVAQASYACVYKDQPMLDIQSQTYTKLVEDITYYELVLLETLGFEVQVDHPHPHVVKCMQFLKASKDLAQMAYFMAHNSLLLTTFCLEHTPSTVACVCIHLSCRWKGLDIPRSSDGKSWWEYIDPSITRVKLDELTKEFLMIYDKSPSRLQKKITDPIKMQGINTSTAPSTSSGIISVGSGVSGRGLGQDKGKHPIAASGSHGHSVKQKSHSQSGSHGNKPQPLSGRVDIKNHSRHHTHSQTTRGVKRQHSTSDPQGHGKKRVKTESHNTQPPLPASQPLQPPLPSGPPPNYLSHHLPLPSSHSQHSQHHRQHKQQHSLAPPPLPPPLPLSPSPPPPPPPR